MRSRHITVSIDLDGVRAAALLTMILAPLGCAQRAAPPSTTAPTKPPVQPEKTGDDPRTDDSGDAPTSRPTTDAARESKEYWLANADVRARFLESRIRTGQMLGTFDGMVSMWYAVMDVLVSCKTDAVAKTPLHSPFPDFYRPTWNEYFNVVARQTRTHWQYQDDKYGFMFVEPGLPLPFEIDLATGWRSEDRGAYVACIPTQAPVGMDVYVLGEYSTDENEAALHEKVRNEWALRFARPFATDVKVGEMDEVKLNGADALFFEATHPKTKMLWRQWVFVNRASCFAIVSAIHPDLNETLWPDVKAMAASFRLKVPGRDEER